MNKRKRDCIKRMKRRVASSSDVENKEFEAERRDKRSTCQLDGGCCSDLEFREWALQRFRE
jgi:hypothetical protein